MPKPILVPIPPQFKPLLDKEVSVMGCYGLMECMGRILDAYFNGKQGSQEKEARNVKKGSKKGDSRLPRVQATVVGRH